MKVLPLFLMLLLPLVSSAKEKLTIIEPQHCWGGKPYVRVLAANTKSSEIKEPLKVTVLQILKKDKGYILRYKESHSVTLKAKSRKHLDPKVMLSVAKMFKGKKGKPIQFTPAQQADFDAYEKLQKLFAKNAKGTKVYYLASSGTTVTSTSGATSLKKIFDKIKEFPIGTYFDKNGKKLKTS